MDLEKYMRNRGNKPISEKTSLAWLEQIIGILKVIHDQNFLHRDIKPSNIILKPEGELVLIDFGAVREMSQTYAIKSTGTFVCSLGYTSPEQQTSKAIPQSDFFALGRTFVFLLTGKEIKDLELDETAKELIWQEHAMQISERLIRIIDSMVAYAPAKRPSSAEDIIHALESISKKPSPKGQSNSKPYKTNLKPYKTIRKDIYKRVVAFVLDYFMIGSLFVGIAYFFFHEALLNEFHDPLWLIYLGFPVILGVSFVGNVFDDGGYLFVWPFPFFFMLFVFAYPIFSENSKAMGTLGKSIVGLKVLRVDLKKASKLQIWFRTTLKFLYSIYIGGSFLFFIPAVIQDFGEKLREPSPRSSAAMLLGCVWLISTLVSLKPLVSGGRLIHDIVSGTLVVSRKK
ncbi:Serine-threonine kinase domain protein [Halomicronema hongdechloris C2206]|uniref:non-specific serine/threonine protein kinase n=2 Tax=Halomicronema hongdechloris TaxID=1209493 RepID=A0A1Z3HGS7_9CYAN|nr:Serine-threonine kinase domain protein [Halomicronema hongdechloris C2206]